jgi:integrase
MMEMHFGAERQLDTITKFDIEQFRLKLAGGNLAKALIRGRGVKLSTSSVDKYLRNVRTLFTAAFDDELIPRDPTRKLHLAPMPASEWQKVTPEDFWKLYNAAEGGMKTLLALCRLAALRYSDAMALTWSHVRFDDGVLVFRPGKIERFVKRDARVPICAELRTILEEARQSSYRIDGFVVARDVPRDVGIFKFPALYAKTGVVPRDKPLHTLRKSCIDDWARVAPPNVVIEWATHSSLHTTMKYYSKVSPTDEQIGMANLFKVPAAAVVAG